MKLYIYSLVMLVLFSGCSGLTYVLHENPYKENLKSIELKKSERVLVLEQTSGYPFGGLYPGVFSLDSNIVEVENVDKGRTTYVYITGRNIGEATLSYIPLRFETIEIVTDNRYDSPELKQADESLPSEQVKEVRLQNFKVRVLE